MKGILKKLSKANYNYNIVIICHSGIIKSMMCFIANIPIDEITNIRLDYGHVIHINYNEKEYKIM